MKRLFYLLSAIALVSSCNKADDVIQPNQDVIINSSENTTQLPEVLYASIADGQESESETRTYVTDGNKIVWHAGDAISYFTGTTHNAKYVSNEEDGSEEAIFELDAEAQGSTGIAVNKSYAVYPYNENITVTGEGENQVITVNYPSTQNCTPDPETENTFGKDTNIMVATGDIGNDELLFRNACGYLIIQLASPQEAIEPIIQSVKLTARGGEKIAGDAEITIDANGIPSVTMDESASSAVTIDCTNVTNEIDDDEKKGVLLTDGNSAEFWFALPPVTLSQGIRIEVEAIDADNNQLKFVKETNKVITIERNIPLPMASLNFKETYALQYMTQSGDQLEFANGAFNEDITSHYFDSSLGCFVIRFDAPLTAIGEEAFAGKDITSVSLPATLTTIGAEAFAETDLTEITIPSSVTTIGKSAFYGCTYLATLSFEESNTPLTLMAQEGNKPPFYNSPLTKIDFVRNINYMKSDGTAPYAYRVRENNHHTVAGQGLFAITETASATAYASGGTTVKIGEAITEIPCNAFEYLPITSLTIPGTVTTIGNDAFFECTKLAELTLAPSPTSTTLTVGQDTDGGNIEGLFAYCPLEEINFNREVVYSSYPNDDTEGKGGIFSFYDDDFIPKETTIITIGEQVVTIPKAAFAYANITTIEIPESVTKIEKYAFSNCAKLETVILGHDSTGPDLESTNAFEGTKISTNEGYIVVRNNTIASWLYYAANWGYYHSQGRVKVSSQQ